MGNTHDTPLCHSLIYWIKPTHNMVSIWSIEWAGAVSKSFNGWVREGMSHIPRRNQLIDQTNIKTQNEYQILWQHWQKWHWPRHWYVSFAPRFQSLQGSTLQLWPHLVLHPILHRTHPLHWMHFHYNFYFNLKKARIVSNILVQLDITRLAYLLPKKLGRPKNLYTKAFLICSSNNNIYIEIYLQWNFTQGKWKDKQNKKVFFYK